MRVSLSKIGAKMSAKPDLTKAIDAFVEVRKTILGANTGYSWGYGYSQNERVVRFPIEVDGQSSSAARLEVVGFPQSNDLKFRLSLCWNAAVARLDYTDETHSNTLRQHDDQIPASVTGPHYHSWKLNRRFFIGAASIPKLQNAEPFIVHASFDSILRWFCHDLNISQPQGGHFISLPPRDLLL